MEIKYFRLIKTIKEEGNLVNSSEKLFLTQSALSHQLKVLEERLGVKVFHRARNKWELTKEGIELYKISNTVLSAIEKGFEKIQDIKIGSKGKINMSMECYSFYQGLPSFMQKMALLYPEIDVNLILEATYDPVSKLISNEIDIAIVTSKPNDANLSSIELFDDEIYAVMHKEHILHEKDFLVAKDFEDVHLLIHSFPLETVSIFQHYLIPHKIVPKKLSAIPLTEVSLEMAAANMGIMCLPLWALKSFKLSDDLVIKKIGKDGLKRTHFLVVRDADMNKIYIKDYISNFIDDFTNR